MLLSAGSDGQGQHQCGCYRRGRREGVSNRDEVRNRIVRHRSRASLVDGEHPVMAPRVGVYVIGYHPATVGVVGVFYQPFPYQVVLGNGRYDNPWARRRIWEGPRSTRWSFGSWPSPSGPPPARHHDLLGLRLFRRLGRKDSQRGGKRLTPPPGALTISAFSFFYSFDKISL